ncbi:MAG: hypothetical protein OEW83_12850 [Acidimicrobiia bacterium]|nr:hypothetical protein [Acidimicrobiia bacterium]
MVNDHGRCLVLERDAIAIAIVSRDFLLMGATGAQVRDHLEARAG